MSVRSRLGALRVAPDGQPRPHAPFGQGPFAARVLRVAIGGSSATIGRLPSAVVHPATRAGATLEWSFRPAKRRRLAENLCHTLALPPDHPRVRALVLREV